MTRRRKLRNVRYRQWVRYLARQQKLPVRWPGRSLAFNMAWHKGRWWK